MTGVNGADGIAAEVSLCIPAWRAAPFIARTLDCALRQTHPRTRVLVSVDQCVPGR